MPVGYSNAGINDARRISKHPCIADKPRMRGKFRHPPAEIRMVSNEGLCEASVPKHVLMVGLPAK